MIPVLYKANETKFDSQGVGCLTDCITCYVHEKLNGVYELKFTYPITGVHFSDIKVGAIVDATPSDGKAVQHFRIDTITKPIGGKVTVEATHISYQLSYVPVKPFDAVGVLEALNGLKENSLASNPFSVWTDISNTATKYSQKEPASFRQRLGGVAGSILDCFGGEYEFDNYTVKLYAHRGTDRGVVIEYGKNLTDLEQEESIDKVITGIVPFWKDSNGDKVVSIETPIESEYASKYPFKRTVVKDFSSNFEEEPTVEQLRTYTESYIKNNCVGVPQVSLDVSFVALEDTEEYKSLSRERINLGDTVTVRFAELGVDAKAKVIEYKYDVLAERYDSLKIGSVRSSLASTISEITKVADSAVTKSILDAVIKYQTELIKGGFGGYLVTNYVNGYPSEIICGDSPNIEQMVNCIRLNKNGLGISKSGYNGPYSTAITGNGINASLINFGEMDGNLIKAKTLQIGSFDEATENTITSSLSEAVTEWYVSTSPTELKGGSWSETRPAWTESNYIWQRLRTENKKGEISYSEPSCVQGNTGAKGDRGEQGKTGSAGADGNSFATLITNYTYTQSEIEKWAKDGYSGEWAVNSSAGVKVGDTVLLRVNNSTKGGYSFIIAKVTTVNSESVVTTVSSGLIDKGDTGVRGSITYTSIFECSPEQSGLYFSGLTPKVSADNPPLIGDMSITPSGKIYIVKAVNVTGDSKTGGGTYAVGGLQTNIKGPQGDKGVAGNGVKSAEITYQIWADGTTTPNGTWIATVPDTTADKPYLWTRTIITYTDNTKSTSYSVGSTLKGVNVGGRNLIGDSEFTNTSWSNNNGFDIVNTNGSSFSYTADGIRTVQKSGWGGTGILIRTDIAPIEYEKTVTLSFDLKLVKTDWTFFSANANKVGDANWWAQGVPTTSTGVDVAIKDLNNWHRVSCTIKIPAKNSMYEKNRQVLIRLISGQDGANYEYYMKNLKFELGNIATDWTPAPEDVDSDISNAQTTANSAKTNASTAQQSANDAQSTANDALNKANSAQASANSAIKSYQDAINKAKDAQISADRATELANGAQQGVSNIEQVVKIDTQGVRIYEKENSKNYVHQKSDGSHFYTNNAENGVLGPDSRMNNLAVNDYFMSASHRMEYGNVLNQDASVFYHIGKLKKVVQ